MKKKLIVLQEENSDCGVCCLLSIIRYYGGNIPLEQLRISSMTTQEGVKAYNLLECAKQYGLQGKGLRTSNLKRIKPPFIAHLNINQSLTHFVVVYKITDDYLYIMDPSCGEKKLSTDEFKKVFTNILLIFSPTNKIPNIKEEKILDKNIKKILNNNKPNLSKMIIINILVLILSLISSTYISFINRNLLLVAIIFIVLNSLTLILRYVSEISEEKLYYKISCEIISNFYNKILSFPLKYIQLKGTGEIINRIEDLDVILRIAITSRIKLILYMLLIIPLTIIISSLIKEIIIILIPFILINIVIYKKYATNLNNIVDENIYYNNNYNNQLISYINGITSIKHSNSIEYFLDNMNKSKEASNKSNYLLSRMISRFNLLTNITLVITEIALNIVLFLNVKNNTISLEIMFMINILINVLITSILELLKQIPNIYYKKRVTNKIDEMLNIEDGGKKEVEEYHSGNIIIKNLNYSHNNLTQTLKNLTISINKGDKVMIKGKNGCGKSTLFKILIKEYDNYKGHITISDKKLYDITTNSLINNISYLSQDEKLFVGTIRENILLGKDIDLTPIIKICCLEDILSKKAYGIDTFIANGDELSGGEKQLIILARHLVRYKDILIIDEGTSELNSYLEDKILKNIIKQYPDKTLIFVSHKNKDFLFCKIIKL